MSNVDIHVTNTVQWHICLVLLSPPWSGQLSRGLLCKYHRINSLQPAKVYQSSLFSFRPFFFYMCLLLRIYSDNEQFSVINKIPINTAISGIHDIAPLKSPYLTPSLDLPQLNSWASEASCEVLDWKSIPFPYEIQIVAVWEIPYRLRNNWILGYKVGDEEFVS